MGARGSVAPRAESGLKRAASRSAYAGRALGLPSTGPPWVAATALVLALAAYAAIAADVVHTGRLSAIDAHLSAWVARSMPSVAEWIARVLSWIGGWLGVSLVVVVVLVWLLRRGETGLGVLLVVVTLGSQLLNWITKDGYDRPRPTSGSPIDLPSSSSFPSGHAMTGIAVFGLLGLVLARQLLSAQHRAATVIAGFALGLLIGASRIVLNVHFLTDVLGGAALGLAWLAACVLVFTVVANERCGYADPS